MRNLLHSTIDRRGFAVVNVHVIVHGLPRLLHAPLVRIVPPLLPFAATEPVKFLVGNDAPELVPRERLRRRRVLPKRNSGRQEGRAPRVRAPGAWSVRFAPIRRLFALRRRKGRQESDPAPTVRRIFRRQESGANNGSGIAIPANRSHCCLGRPNQHGKQPPQSRRPHRLLSKRSTTPCTPAQ
jgi:hypothetical protein